VDVVLVHAPAAEKEFVAKGFGVNRQEIMENDFLLVGPADDPAKLGECKTAADAMKRLSNGQTAFISRGDDSGTHKAERSLWAAAGVQPKGAWYLEAGQGMGPTLTMANEKQGYTLSDMGTFLAMRKKLNLKVCFQGDPALLNLYSVMAVNPKRHPGTRYDDAMKLVQWLTGADAQALIGKFTIDGEPLFRPKRAESEAK
jgi:tungstate transport system substrate-binding protein